MAKVHLDRLKQRYGWTGGKYRALMRKIIAENTRSIGDAVARVNESEIRRQAKKLGKKFVVVNLPKIEQAIPGPDVYFRKGAERGKLLADSLRDRLAGDLRAAMTDFRTKTGLPGYVRRRGAAKGQMDPSLVMDLRRRIVRTFGSYTRVDPEIGVPANVRAIAITEARSVVDGVKNQYFHRLFAENPKMRMRKRWVHHPTMSRHPRPGHREMHGREVDMDERFPVPVYEGDSPTGAVVLMAFPHDGSGGPEQDINCNCDADYLARMATKKRAADAGT